MNFQEWQHSAFYGEQRSCQSCHMPEVPGRTHRRQCLASRVKDCRATCSSAGNFLVLRMLDRYRADLGVEAPSAGPPDDRECDHPPAAGGHRDGDAASANAAVMQSSPT